MRFFFRNWRDVEIVFRNLVAMQCPFCGVSGTLIGHGFNRGFVAHNCRGVRSRRIRCKKSRRRNGCGITFAIRPADTLPRRCFSAKGLMSFIERLRQGKSVKRSWEQCGIPLTLDTGYRLYRRLLLCMPVLRTHLCSRAPPHRNGEGSAFSRTFDHLEKVFGDKCAVSTYQETLQRDFLAIA